MKKNTNKTEKKKMYCLRIMDDYGELWLGHNKEPIAFIHCNDANFREEYQSFIFDYLNVDLICKGIYIEDDDLIEDEMDIKEFKHDHGMGERYDE